MRKIRILVVSKMNADKCRLRLVPGEHGSIAGVVSLHAFDGVSLKNFDAVIGCGSESQFDRQIARCADEEVPFFVVDNQGQKGAREMREGVARLATEKPLPNALRKLPDPEPVEAKAEVIIDEVNHRAPDTEAIVQWNYKGTMIGLGSDDFVDMTAMWRAVGKPDHRTPNDYLRSTRARDLIEQIRRENSAPEISRGALHRTESGGTIGGGCTKAFWKVAIDYGMYLSPPFHSWCLDHIGKYITSRGAPTAHPVAPRDQLRLLLASLDEQDAASKARDEELARKQEEERLAREKAIADERKAREADRKAAEERANAVEKHADEIVTPLVSKIEDLEFELVRTKKAGAQLSIRPTMEMTLDHRKTIRRNIERAAILIAVDFAHAETDESEAEFIWAKERIYDLGHGKVGRRFSKSFEEDFDAWMDAIPLAAKDVRKERETMRMRGIPLPPSYLATVKSRVRCKKHVVRMLQAVK
jgi:hypothetical protein